MNLSSENNKFEIIADSDVLKTDFQGIDFPFPLSKELKALKKRKGVQYLIQEISLLLKRNPTLSGVACYTSKAVKTCGIYKLRIPKDNNRGKSSGYRVVFLLITILGKGYVLDIADHSIRDDLSDSEKKFCRQLVEEIDAVISKTLN